MKRRTVLGGIAAAVTGGKKAVTSAAGALGNGAMILPSVPVGGIAAGTRMMTDVMANGVGAASGSPKLASFLAEQLTKAVTRKAFDLNTEPPGWKKKQEEENGRDGYMRHHPFGRFEDFKSMSKAGKRAFASLEREEAWEKERHLSYDIEIEKFKWAIARIALPGGKAEVLRALGIVDPDAKPTKVAREGSEYAGGYESEPPY